jgi:hypothetical protein
MAGALRRALVRVLLQPGPVSLDPPRRRALPELHEQSLRDYFAALPAALGGDPAAIWSIDGVHRDYLPAR